MAAPSQSQAEFEAVISAVTGCFSPKQAIYLRELASKVGYGWIVEVGSYRGKSAVALWSGSQQRTLPVSPAVYSVEPHARFTGIYGGEFGPEDRKGFYQTMIETGAYEGVALLNQSSEVVAPGWDRPVGLLVIDGDHTYEGVKRDFECWEKHVVPGGRIVFDDAVDPEIGPYHLVREILADGGYSLESEFTKMVVLRKDFVDSAPSVFQEGQQLKILVSCTRLAARGGYLRFERIAKALKPLGHSVTFATLSDQQDESWAGDVPIINISDAFQKEWDVTMIPGAAGFASNKTRQILEAFRGKQFGLRVQHILNDKSREADFRMVNYSFCPHLVLFNNHHWEPGEYTQFQANQFRRLPGAVDVDAFASDTRKPIPGVDQTVVIGAQSQKNPALLLSILKKLPSNYRLKAFGPEVFGELATEEIKSGRLELVGTLHGNELRQFYESVDVVVSLESAAGWANVGAEALAAGIPLVCSPPGTLSFAKHLETAYVVETLEPEAFADAIQDLVSQPELIKKICDNGKQCIGEFGWDKYSASLIKLCQGAREAEYFRAPELNLYGKWPLDVRLDGLEPLFSFCKAKSVLDLGAAEGAIALECLRSGAKLLHGFELDVDRVERATRLTELFASRTRFRSANLNDWDAFCESNKGLLLEKYDVVCYLGLHHHLDPETRIENLKSILKRARSMFVMRTPAKTFDEESLDAVVRAAGFAPIASGSDDARTTAGGVKIYRRVRSRHRRLLISFPKSGRTWLRYALHELGLDGLIEFQHDGCEFNSSDKPQHDFDFEKRVEGYHANANRVVYLERNPFDLMVSFFHQITGRFKDYHGYEGTVSEFIRDPYFGAPTLKQFRQLWNQLAKQEHVLKVEYESFHEDFAGNLKRILDHFGIEVDEQDVQLASEAASLEAMKKVEADGKFPHPWLRYRNGAAKVRNGKVGSHQEFFSNEDLQYLKSVFHKDVESPNA